MKKKTESTQGKINGESKKQDSLSESLQNQIKQLKHELEEKQKIIGDYTDHLKRLQAEFENYTKRVEKEKQEFTKFATHNLIKNLLTTLDEFESALNACKASQEVTKGFELVFNNFKKILEQEGLKEIRALGQKLDTSKHDVVFQEKTKSLEEDAVLEVLQKGYMLYEAVLRPAKVKIAKMEEAKND